MGFEYRLEAYDTARVEMPACFRAHPLFCGESAAAFHFGLSREAPVLTAWMEAEHVCMCQHVINVDTDALLGFFIRKMLSQNDHVVISEI